MREGVVFLEGPKGSKERRERKEGMPEGAADELETDPRRGLVGVFNDVSDIAVCVLAHYRRSTTALLRTKSRISARFDAQGFLAVAKRSTLVCQTLDMPRSQGRHVARTLADSRRFVGEGIECGVAALVQ